MMTALRTIVRDIAILLAVHACGYAIMANFRIMDQLLAPAGSPSMVLLALSIMFMCLRLFLICFLPGWVLLRLYRAWLFPEKSETVGAVSRE